MPNPPEGWKLITLCCGNGGIDIHFAHYTGRELPGGGYETDAVLDGQITEENLRLALGGHLSTGAGNKRERCPPLN